MGKFIDGEYVVDNSDKLVNEQGEPIREGGFVNGEYVPGNDSGLDFSKETQFQGRVLPGITESFRLGKYDISREKSNEDMLHVYQPMTEVLGRAVAKFGIGIPAGIVAGLNYDVVDMADMMAGTEKEYGNFLSEITAKLQKKGQDFTIYKDGDNIGNVAYWADLFGQSGFSAGLAIEMFTEQALLSALTTATLGGTAGLQALNIGRKAKMLGTVAFGSMKGIQEAYINGLETFETTRDEYLNRGYSEEEAMKNASEAASLGYKMELGPLMVLNTLQLKAVGKYNPFGKGGGPNLGYSGAVEGLSDVVFSGIKSKGVKGALDVGFNIISEGVEEGIQSGIGQYATHEQLKSTGDVFTDFDPWNVGMRDAVFGGMIGGGMFAGIGKVANTYSEHKTKQQYGERVDEFLAGATKRNADNLQTLKEIRQTGNQDAERRFRYKMQKDAVYETLMLDYASQSEGAFEDHVGRMQEVKEALNTKDLETLKKYKLTTEEDFEFIAEHYDTFIKDAIDIKAKFIENMKVADDFDIAMRMTDSQKVLEDQTKYANDSRRDQVLMVEQDKAYQELTSTGKKEFDLSTEVTFLQEKGKLVGLTKDEQERYIEAQEELKIHKVENRTYKGQAADRRAMKAIKQEPIFEKMAEVSKAEQMKGVALDRITYWNNSKNVKKQKIANAERAIEVAKTVEETKEAAKKLTEEGKLNKKTSDKVDVKVNELEADQAVETSVEESPPTPEQVQIEVAKEKQLKNVIQAASEDLSKPQGIEEQPKRPADFEEDSLFDPSTSTLDNVYDEVVKFFNEVRNVSDPTFEEIEIVLKKLNAHPKIIEYSKQVHASKSEVARLEGLGAIISSVNQEYESPEDSADKNENPKTRKVSKAEMKRSESSLAAAVLSKLYKYENQVINGVKTRVKVDISDKLNANQWIDNTIHLDPKQLNPGTKLSVRVPENFGDITVTVWDDATIGKESETKMTFQEWVEKFEIVEGSQEWNDKIPMIAYLNGVGAFFVHDTQWYNPKNISDFDGDFDTRDDVITQGQNVHSDFRQNVMKNGSVEIQIDKKGYKSDSEQRSVHYDIITEPSAYPTLSENVGGNENKVMFGYIDNNKDIIINGKPIAGVIPNVEIENPESLSEGSPVEIRRGATKNGYVMLSIVSPPLGTNMVTSLMTILEAKFKGNEEIIKKVLEVTGFDIRNGKDFGDFLNAFIYTQVPKFDPDAGDIKSLKEVLDQFIGQEIPIFFSLGGKVYFGHKTAEMNSDRLQSNINKIGQGANLTREITLAGLAESGFHVMDASTIGEALPALKVFLDATTKKPVVQNVTTQDFSIPFFNEEGQLESTVSYQTYLKNTLKTNVKSHNIGTEEIPNYITIVQPNITYSPTSQAVTPKEIAEESTTKATEEIKEQTDFVEEDIFTEVSPKETAIQPKAQGTIQKDQPSQEQKEVLGEIYDLLREDGHNNSEIMDLLKSELLGDDLTDPAVSSQLNDRTIAVLTEMTSEIAELNLREEIEIVSYLYNQMALKVFKTEGGVLKQEAIEEFKTLIEGKKETHQEVLVRAEALLKENSKYVPILEALQNKIKKIDSTVKNVKTLGDKAGEMLAKYTKIQEVELLEHDYTKTSLEEKGKQHGSYLLKRFYAGIKERTLSGDVKKGIFGVDTYVGFDRVDDAVKSLLNGTTGLEPNYDNMMGILEEYVEKYPWLIELKQNLDNPNTSTQIKNTFVAENYRHSLSMKFVMSKRTKSGTYALHTFDTASQENYIAIRNDWETSLFMSSDVIYYDNESGEYKISSEKSRQVINELATSVGMTFNWETPSKSIKTLGIELQKYSAKKDGSNQPIFKLLNTFGITLSDKALEKIKKNGYSIKGKTGTTQIQFTGMFNPSPHSSGVFGHLLNNLVTSTNKKTDTEIGETKASHPFGNMFNVLKKLAIIESQYSIHTPVTSFRDADKSIYGFPLRKSATDTEDALKVDDDTYRETFLDKVFSKNSIWLGALQDNHKFRELFKVHHLGINALKEYGRKPFGKNKVGDLADPGHEMVKLGLFQDMQMSTLDTKNERYTIPGTTFQDTRIARMFFPTMSDKDQMLVIETLVLDITQKHLNKDLTNPTEEILDIIYNQTVEPELNRIIEFFTKQKGQTDIIGYDEVAGLFLMIPALNTIKYKGSTIGSMFNSGKHTKTGRLKKGFLDRIEILSKDTEFLAHFKNQAKSVISSFLTEKVNGKVKIWNEYYVDTVDGKKEIKYLDSQYFDKNRMVGDIDTKLKIAAYDYVINSMISNANLNMLFAGDLALYSNQNKNKLESYFKDGEVGSPKTDSSYKEFVEQQIDSNMGKRLALLLAPRKGLAGSKHSTYLRVYLEDYIDATTNLTYLSKLLDGKEMTVEQAEAVKLKAKQDIGDTLNLREQNLIDEHYNTEGKSVKDFFPNTSAFFSLEGSDAQEYTTASEHLEVLFNEGYINDDLYYNAQTKIQAQTKFVSKRSNKGKSIPRDLYISSEDLKLILQPQKPIHSGFHNDKKLGIKRMIYVKSSSFPLIPQLTKGLQLENLRIALEELESKQTKKTVRLSDNREIQVSVKGVRASYQTANKVGGTKNSIRPFDSNNKYNTKLGIKDYQLATIELDRINFGIQQDVPVKFTESKQDEISLGTQTLKLLFGDGVKNINTFDFTSILDSSIKLKKGQDILEHFNDVWVNYIRRRKESVLKRFYLDENFESTAPLKTLNKIQAILKKEASERGYPKQDIQALDLSISTVISFPAGTEFNEIYLKPNELNFIKEMHDGTIPADTTNITKYEGLVQFTWETTKDLGSPEFKFGATDFTVPVWFSTNPNRYESLLNSIVNKAIINPKLPGDSFVTGSEAGFKLANNLEGIDKSKMIFTRSFNTETGELTAAEKNEDGSLKKAQVFMPSRFRDNEGKLITFIYDDGSFNADFIEQDSDTGMLFLKEGVIDSELLHNTSFRIPTSSHVSMAQTEVVGFLPPETGDLIIVPKNFTVQKGLDFDVDKENLYKYHTYLTEDNKLKILTEANIDEDMNWLPDLYFEMKADYYKGQNIDADIERLEDEVDALTEQGFDAFPETLKRIEKQKIKKSTINVTKEDYLSLRTEFNQFFVETGKNKYKINDSIKRKTYENEIVNIQNTVLSNPDPKMQGKINKALSMEFARSQASRIQKETAKTTTSLNWSPLDDEHQKHKMSLGQVGKMGIGVYSNFVVFHSLVQQTENPITVMANAEKSVSIDIGGYHSDGTLGLETALTVPRQKGTRRIAEVFAERQNTATDNEKEQIMGRANINEVTIGVDSLLTLLGFDQAFVKETIDGKKVTTPISLPYFLLSQPIIKNYVKQMRNSKSIISDYNPNAKEDIYNRLLGALSKKQKSKLVRDRKTLLTPDELVKQISEPTEEFQKTVLYLFKELETKAEQISKYQQRININRDGLGKSFFDVISKWDFLSNPTVKALSGGEQLIGEYLEKTIPEENADSTVKELQDEGYVITKLDYTLTGASIPLVEIKAIKPKTPLGSMLVYGVQTGYNMWKDFFPYDSPIVEKVITNLEIMISDSESSPERRVEVKQKIFQELKKFLASSTALGIINGDPKAERERLATDTKTQKSLSTYLHDLLQNPKYEFLRANPLLTSLGTTGRNLDSYSTITMDNTQQANFDEDYLYASFSDLIKNNKELPNLNGEIYSTQKLAMDLISYAYLEGGVQEAIQFVKYVPIELLKNLPFGRVVKSWNQKMKNPSLDRVGASGLGLSDIIELHFTKQFAQHNGKIIPSYEIPKVKKGTSWLKSFEKFESVKFLDGNSRNLDNLLSFTLEDGEVGLGDFTSIYNPYAKKGGSPYLIFELTDMKTYNRIPTLGVHGMNEYSILEQHAESNIHTNTTEVEVQVEEEISVSTVAQSLNLFGMTTEPLTKVIENILDYEFTSFPEVKTLLKHLKDNGFIPNDVTIEIVDIIQNGKYSPSTKTIQISSQLFVNVNPEAVAKVLLKELTHRLTYHEMEQYMNKDGSLKIANVPPHITNIKVVFEEFKRVVETKYGRAAINQIEELAKTGSLTVEQKERVFPATSIFEFVEVMFTEPGTQKWMNEVPYKKSGENFLERFTKLVQDLFSALTKGKISFAAIKATLAIVEADKVTSEKTEKQQMETTNVKADAVIDKAEKILSPEKQLPLWTIEDETYTDPSVINAPEGLPSILRTPKNCK